ncbi:hypothetical protein, partial [Serratia marcescens]|uniref:hypothetical protein n=1 Tax=Serratia marcescens TaxID=615 RepID=UPI001954B43D
MPLSSIALAMGSVDTIRPGWPPLDKIAEKLNIIPPTYSDFRESMKISLEYKLLPSDALTLE